MALSKIQAESMNLADTFAFTGTVTGAGDLSVGVSQTWQNVTSSRTHGTTYTNSTGRPIMVSICTNMGTNQRVDSTVGGVDIQDHGGSTIYGAMGFNIFIVPNNTTYKVDRPQGTIQYWAELR